MTEYEEIWEEAAQVNDPAHWNRVPDLLEDLTTSETLMKYLCDRAQIQFITVWEHKTIWKVLGKMAEFNPRFRAPIARALLDLPHHPNANVAGVRLSASEATIVGFGSSTGPYMVQLANLIGQALVVEPVKSVRASLFLAYKALINAMMQAELARLRRSVE